MTEQRRKRGGKLPLGWLTYEEARAIAHTRKIKSRIEYFKWHDNNRIRYLPRRPNRVYKDEWTGWNDFLGNHNLQIGEQPKKWRPYWDAMKYVHTLNLKTIGEWNEFKNSGQLPDDIPKSPHAMYKDHWSGYRTWLGVDVSSKADIATAALETAMWVIVQDRNDPPNVIWWKKVSTQFALDQWMKSGTIQVIRKFKFEPELEQVTKDIIEKHSTTYYGDENHRLVQNLNMLLWDLTHELLMV